MAHVIRDYSTLQAQIQLWTARSDTDFVAALPSFISMAEQRMAFGSAVPFPSDPVRVRDMQTTVPITVIDGIGVLPTDYLEQTSMTWDSDLSKVVRYLPPEEFHGKISGGPDPTLFTIENGQLLLKAAATGTANFVYYAMYPNLDEAAETNWLLENTPALYLKGSLIEAFSFTRNKEARDSAYADYISVANGLTMQTRKALQPASLYPTIPGADHSTELYRG